METVNLSQSYKAPNQSTENRSRPPMGILHILISRLNFYLMCDRGDITCYSTFNKIHHQLYSLSSIRYQVSLNVCIYLLSMRVCYVFFLYKL